MAPVQLVQERSLGLGWLEVSRRILEHGLDESYDGAGDEGACARHPRRR